MLDRAFFASYRVIPEPRWEGAVTGAFRAMAAVSGTRVTVHGFRLPERPVLFVSNSTQKYDFMLLRAEARRLGLRAVTVTKAKNYHSPMKVVLDRTGVVPIASKGYLLLADHLAVTGVRPDEEAYRAMRRHVDSGEPLPATPAFRALAATPRSLLGYRFEPAQETWRELVRRVYRGMMAETVRLAREARDAGYHIHMYPEGTVSSRLGVGRAGAVQLARALDLPIVPFGMNGCRDAFRGQSAVLTGGLIELCFGEPFSPDLSALPASFRPFDPEDERAHQGALQSATEEVMTRLDQLLWPSLRRVEGFAHDGTAGTRRFL